MKFLKCLIAVCILGVLFSCSKVYVAPSLSTSLSYNAYKNIEKIDIRDASIGLFFGKDLLNAKIHQNKKMGEFDFEIGKSFAVKFIKALSHQFKTILLIDKVSETNKYDLDAIMRVSLQNIEYFNGVKKEILQDSVDRYTRLSVRAELRDLKEQKIIWVGTSKVDHTGDIEKKMSTHQETGRRLAKGYDKSIDINVCELLKGYDKAIDIAVGELLKQMQKSQKLNKYFVKWESYK